ncbi:D-galactosamine-6-phosphate deaminase AgaS [Commensalibacter sp. Nvir]|uniref:SIS domain-containing protein n=1 Tax=Commensalibacter sp. Nvir TaxID=3069817 RepID=UPI002D420C6C|nr:D-galactosamine-6-phosphate deaminase AgaS [Commensalibacter sp. Nvir]
MSLTQPISKANHCLTINEIMSQPSVWRKFAEQNLPQCAEIRSWINARKPKEIWLCGAGTSAYIGQILCGYFSQHSSILYRHIPTTDLVSTPNLYVHQSAHILVVSFGRSGNSSESIAALDLLDKFLPKADRLNITCNAKSALATRTHSGTGQQQTLILPDSAHDQGFAMTASFTTMVLAALACFDPLHSKMAKTAIMQLAEQGETLLDKPLTKLIDSKLASCPERAIFLGSGSLLGVARESALKVLELTKGKIATLWESSLGFRHGPKSIISDKTIIFANLSLNPYTQLYDLDMINELKTQFPDITLITLGSITTKADIIFNPVYNDCWSSVLYVLTPQLAAAHWGLKLGIHIDTPFAGGELNRVVSGVKIYPYANEDN